MGNYPYFAVRRAPRRNLPRSLRESLRRNLPRGPAAAGALARSCHPLPTLAVTTFVTAVAVAAGRGAAGSAGVGAAVLAGQLSVGWCNDAVDARRDAMAGRTGKPAATGEVAAPVVGTAAGAALAACVPLSLLGGPAAGAAHLTGVLAGGWAYDLGLKRTLWSPLPYAVGFGTLPAFVTLGLPGRPWPAWWAVAGAALLGVGAHLVNVLPDLEADRATGVRGLPQRLGREGVRRSAPFVLLGAVAVVAVGPSGPVRPLDWAVLGAAASATAAGVARPADDTSDLPFRTAIAVAALAVVLYVSRGGRLV